VDELAVKHRNGKSAPGALRERVAEEAARIMIEHGVRDFAAAKRKAAERLGLHMHGALPSNAMVEERLAVRQRIFEPDEHLDRLLLLRHTALTVMDRLAEFEPRLVGHVLAGTATLNAVIELHVFSDVPEDVTAALAGAGWDFRTVERKNRVSKGAGIRIPAVRFTAEDQEVLVEIYPEDGIRQAPLSPIDQRPMKRAARKAVQALLEP
jgi:hypothetical protein